MLTDLRVTTMLVDQRNDGANMLFLDDIQSLWTVDENTVKDIQHTCQASKQAGVKWAGKVQGLEIQLARFILLSMSLKADNRHN
jgi:hypothetical protein